MKGVYPSNLSGLDVTPAKLEEISGLSVTALTPGSRSTIWLSAGINLCIAEFLLGSGIGIDPIYTLIPLTIILFSVDQLAYRGAVFESIYRKLFPQYKKKIIYHEAGHFLIAYLLGIPLKGVVTNAWDAQKYREIQGQAGTIFVDPKLAEELANNRVTRKTLDRLSVVFMAGIASEALNFGRAEGGLSDEQELINFFTSVSPPWNMLRIQSQARWAVMQAILLIREHQTAFDALVGGKRSY